MKRSWVLIAIALQVASVAYIAASKEWTLAFGDEIVLQTAPVDPRDIFRGDYVRLKYSASTIPAHLVDEDDLRGGLRKGQKVFASILLDEQGLAEVSALSTKRPGQGLYLTAYTKRAWPYYRSGLLPTLVSLLDFDDQKEVVGVAVRYGLEQYYVEQGAGLAMEVLRGNRDDYQVAMLIHAAVSNGSSVIRSFEWSNLSIKTELLQDRGIEGAKIKVSIRNRLDEVVTLPWKENGCSLKLRAVNSAPYAAARFLIKRPQCEGLIAKNLMLEKDQEVSAIVDFAQPQWQVMFNDKLTPLHELSLGYRFRLAHEQGNIEGVKGKLVSASFHARGNID